MKYSAMTFNTYRLDIKPMLWRVAGMVILFCLFGAIFALQGVWMGHFTRTNSITNSTSGLTFFREFNPLFNSYPDLSSFRFFAFFIAFSGRFANFCLQVISIIFIMTCLTVIMMSIFPRFLFVKLRKGFNFFAFGALFCYDWFRHSFFLTKRLCFRTVQTQYLCGFSNCTQWGGLCK